jgi:cell division septation protein DedD
MDNALKQRVLGVIVLFALIGICITVLLHNNKVAQQQGLQHARQIIASSQKTTSTQQKFPVQTNTPTPTSSVAVIAQQPAAPTTDSVFNDENAVEATPAPSVQTVQSAPISRKKTKSITETVSTPTATTTITTTNTTTASPATATFSVQVGTFSKRENATALVKALHERGFSSATTQSITTKHGDMTRVVIGGNGLTRKEAETIKLHLSKNLHLGCDCSAWKSKNHVISCCFYHKTNNTLGTHSACRRTQQYKNYENNNKEDGNKDSYSCNNNYERHDI